MVFCQHLRPKYCRRLRLGLASVRPSAWRDRKARCGPARRPRRRATWRRQRASWYLVGLRLGSWGAKELPQLVERTIGGASLGIQHGAGATPEIVRLSWVLQQIEQR